MSPRGCRFAAPLNSGVRPPTMRGFFKQLLVMALLTVVPGSALAQHRGGTCNAFVCDLTAMAVLAAISVVFFASLAVSIKHRGWFKGVVSHGGVQLVAGYLAILAVCAALAFGAFTVFGKV